ncbi:MAG: tetratricopeptide repeat protein [Muribaculaceae bacterium]|nr:tetratricopeptide repeat protein [Muribaculaceae bacterium]
MHPEKRNIRFISIIGPVIMTSMLIFSFLCSCRRSVDPRLVDADSIIEECPDSAMIILDEYEITDNSSEYDRALYGLLLTHARYKNFIDEADDSIISAAADYFLEQGDKEEAARALFLKGMIEMNADKLGEASVAFSHGLDIAREGKLYMWEGQCARGLFMVYTFLCDGSAQIQYAKMAYEAFMMTGNVDWINYSKLELARAYNNSLNYDKTIEITAELLKLALEKKDTLILSESLQLRGVAFLALGKFDMSIESYSMACELNPVILTDKDKRNINIAIHEKYGDDIPECLSWIIEKAKVLDTSKDSFGLFADQDKYKEAYESLVKYKNSQDSVLSHICRNNVAESISNYEKMRKALAEEKKNNYKLLYCILILVFIVVSCVGFWISREKILSEKSMRLKAEADLESLRSDLLTQLEKTEKSKKDDSNSTGRSIDKDFVKIIRSKYSEANSLCDNYYQGKYNKKDKEKITSEINNIVNGLKEKSSVDRIEEYVNETSDGLYASFKSDFFDITEDNRRLFLYLMLGFSSRTISVIFNLDISAVYNKKSRLKARITKSQASKKEEYLKFF